jgi:hypothetical protein
MGGALGRTQPHHGALAKLDGEFIMFAGGMAMEPGMTAANETQLALLTGALAPYESGQYGNFVERKADTSAFFDADTYSRLQRVKGEYDPDGVFRANHAIEAA